MIADESWISQWCCELKMRLVINSRGRGRAKDVVRVSEY